MLSYARQGKREGMGSVRLKKSEGGGGWLGRTRGLALRMRRSANDPGATTPSLPSCLSIFAVKFQRGV